MGRAEYFENVMGGAGPRILKMRRAVIDCKLNGPGRGPSSEKMNGRAEPRLMIPKFDGPSRVTAHERWTLYRPPTCFHGLGCDP